MEGPDRVWVWTWCRAASVVVFYLHLYLEYGSLTSSAAEGSGRVVISVAAAVLDGRQRGPSVYALLSPRFCSCGTRGGGVLFVGRTR